MVDSCMAGRKILTRTDSGIPVYEQMTQEGGKATLHTFTVGLPIENTTATNGSIDNVCHGLVNNASKPLPADRKVASNTKR